MKNWSFNFCCRPQGPTKSDNRVFQKSKLSKIDFETKILKISSRVSNCRTQNLGHKISSNVEHSRNNSQKWTVEHRTTELFHCFRDYPHARDDLYLPSLGTHCEDLSAFIVLPVRALVRSTTRPRVQAENIFKESLKSVKILGGIFRVLLAYDWSLTTASSQRCGLRRW